MIKRIRFATRDPGAAAGEVATEVRAALESGLAGGEDVRPLRVALCTALTEVIADQRHDAVGLEWFADAGHLQRFEQWSAAHGHPPDPGLLSPGASGALAVDEVVLRGQDWMEHRWRDGGEALKHMALARRAKGLTPAEFSQRWKDRAGMVRAPGTATTMVIPDEARGNAYVQNHPLPRPADEWGYDAVNEVYFESLDGLRRRIAWFDETLGGGTEDDLVSESWFLAVREVVLRLP